MSTIFFRSICRRYLFLVLVRKDTTGAVDYQATKDNVYKDHQRFNSSVEFRLRQHCDVLSIVHYSHVLHHAGND